MKITISESINALTNKLIKFVIITILLFGMFQSKLVVTENYKPIDKNNLTNFIIAVHGGAGSYNRTKISEEKEKEIKKGLLEALKVGYEVLRNNGSHIDATRETVIKLEDNPLYNAGKGGKLNRNFEVELDASIMDGSNLKCGAVGGIKHIKNPIKAAELIMKTTPYIMLASQAADEYAKEKGLEYVPNYYFFTMDRIEEWFNARKRIEHSTEDIFNFPRKGTIGVVAMDTSGHLAAGTSTGGTTYKMAGRIGDTPILGAGNYANDETCAISCTGEGETMMRKLIAFDIHARMLYKNISLSDSTKEVMHSLPDDTGGFIAIDKFGNLEMPYNSGGMARGFVRQDGIANVLIFDEISDLTPIEYNITGINQLI